ncbi:MAG: MATE family efflux transporter [Flavobacteriaceae bacterium]|nr:MATE family efflux transporter [Flavobacteriaceae bacterium]
MGLLTAYTKEFRYNLKLAIPVITSLLGHTFVQLVDNIMVGQLGTASLAGISLGNSFFWIAMSLGIGFSTAITPLIAEADGEGNLIRVRKVLNHSIIACVIMGLILAVSVLISQPLLFKMGQPNEVVGLAYNYLFWVAISLIPLIVFEAFKKFSDGLSHTKPAMYATLLSNLLNIVLNYMLIFGKWGAPALGVEGAAIGTLISRIFALFFLFTYLKIDERFSPYFKKIINRKLDITIFRKIFNLGLPSAGQMFFEVGFFTCAVWLSGLLGKNSQAANQIALNLSTITFMFASGLGVTSMIRVGILKGRNNFIELRRIAISTFFLIFIFDIVFCLLFLIFNNELPWLYLDLDSSHNKTDIYEVIYLASNLLIIAAFFQISDGLQAVVLGALRGMQDVNIPTLITFISYGLIGLPVSYIVGIYYNIGVSGIWIGLLTGLSASSTLLFLRFQYLTKSLISKYS